MFKSTFSLGLTSCLVLCTAAATTVCRADSGADNSLEPGAWSIQFRVDENFQLDSFNGSAISIKRHGSERRAWRAGLSFGTSLDGIDSKYVRPDTSYERQADGNNQSVSGSLAFLVYPSPDRDVLLYLGLGPTFSFSRNKSSYEDLNSYNYRMSWSAGLGSIIGVEWFARRGISLLAEYTSSVSFRFNSREDSSDDRNTETDYWSVGIGSTGVRFGLSAYF